MYEIFPTSPVELRKWPETPFGFDKVKAPAPRFRVPAPAVDDVAPPAPSRAALFSPARKRCSSDARCCFVRLWRNMRRASKVYAISAPCPCEESCGRSDRTSTRSPSGRDRMVSRPGGRPEYLTL